MTVKKFIPTKADKEVISMRISSSVLAVVDEMAAKYDISRNEFINQCINFALENIETDNPAD